MGFTSLDLAVKEAKAVRSAKRGFVECLDSCVCPICRGMVYHNGRDYECQDNKYHRFRKSGKHIAILDKNNRGLPFELAYRSDTSSVAKRLGYSI